MSAFCIHATDKCNVENIVRNGLLASSGLYHWLGYGAYAYRVCSDAPRGALVAFNNALTFVKQKNAVEAGCILLEVATNSVLDLQHPAIYASLEQFRKLVLRRARDLGFRIEQNNGLFRPEAHFVIDAFVLVIETLSGLRIDLVQAQFHGKESAILDEIKTPELCIKNPRAVISTRSIASVSEIPRLAADGCEWLPCNAVLRAAERATEFVRNLAHADFANLVFKIAESVNIATKKPRFQAASRVSIVARNRNSLSESLLNAWRTISPTNLLTGLRLLTDELMSLSGPEELRRIDELVEKSAGLIVVADAQDGCVDSLLLRASEKRLPILVVAKKGVRPPSQTRSAMNISIIDVAAEAPEKELTTVVTGFMANNWTRNSIELSARLAIAARNCRNMSYNGKVGRYQAIKRIIEKTSRIRDDRELPGLFGNGDTRALLDLPDEPELAATTLRKRMELDKQRLSAGDLLKTLGRARSIQLRLDTPGFLIPPGLHGSEYVVALRDSDPITRQKFTIAHEIGHAIVAVSKFDLSGLNEEEWCDKFAASVLMPEQLVSEFAEKAISLGSWFEFADTFGVSKTAAMRRLWQCRRILLVCSNGNSRDFSPVPTATRDLLEISANTSSGEVRGCLLNTAPFIIRGLKSGVEALADFSGVSPHELVSE